MSTTSTSRMRPGPHLVQSMPSCPWNRSTSGVDREITESVGETENLRRSVGGLATSGARVSVRPRDGDARAIALTLHRARGQQYIRVA